MVQGAKARCVCFVHSKWLSELRQAIKVSDISFGMARRNHEESLQLDIKAIQTNKIDLLKLQNHRYSVFL